MSGGYFSYDQHRITGITEEISLLIRNNKKKDKYGFMRNYSHATIEKFKEAESVMRLAAMMVQRIDWLVCDDDGEGTFHERWDEDMRAIESLTARGRGLKQGGNMPPALDSLFVEPGDERIKLECADRVEAEFRVMVANPDIDNLDAIRKLRFKQVAQLRAAIMGSNPAGN